MIGYDISPTAIDRFIAEGGRGAATPANAAKNADIVVSVVVNSAQTEAMLFGPDGVAETMKPEGRLHLVGNHGSGCRPRSVAACSRLSAFTISMRRFRAARQRRQSGELTIMASGSRQAFDTARPALDAMASKVYELGDAAGTGAAFKMINQLLAGVHIAAACEAITFAAKQGLDLDKVYEVITASAGNSWMFENRVPHVLAGDYTPLSAIEIFVKDLGIVQDMARSERYPVPLVAAALQMYLAASGAGMGRDDDASLARLYAQLSGAKLPGVSGEPQSLIGGALPCRCSPPI